MTLEELKRREKELRRKYGDDMYEKYYLQQYNREKASAAPSVVTTRPLKYNAAPMSPKPAAPPRYIKPSAMPHMPEARNPYEKK